MKTKTAKPGEKVFRKLCQKVGKTITEHRMLQDGDHVLVALSGGKDSNILLETLADRKKAFPFHFNITAVHVRVMNLGMPVPPEWIKGFCRDSNIPYLEKEIEIDFKKDPKKAPCYVCSWHKRKEIFNLGRELKCNKLAFGHHRDDALQTLVMNMVYHGSISSLPYTLSMFNGRVKLIRPLMDIYEKELEEYSRHLNSGQKIVKCPYDGATRRFESRQVLDMLNGMYPKAKINIFRSMSHIFSEYLPINKQ